MMRCRYCEASTGEPVIRLGEQPFANSFLSAEQVREVEAGRLHEPRLPLDLHLCSACGLVQISESPPPEQLFTEYIYVSGTSDLIHRHALELATCVPSAAGTGALPPFVVEIASNDGTVLQAFRRRGCRVLGVEPAANVAAVARAQGIETRVEFFGPASGAEIRQRSGPADLVLARHVLAHLPDPGGFLQGVRSLLARDGVLMIEAPYLEHLLSRCEFDTIYHEHLTYLAARPLARLLARHGLEIFDLRPYDIHGGSMLYLVAEAGRRPASRAVMDALEREQALGLAQRPTWETFASRVEALGSRLRDLLRDLRAAGRTIAGYGAPAKGNTLLGYLGIGRETIQFLADRNPWKQGRYTPGSHIPVRPPECLLEDRPDYALLLAWNFETEILEQQREFRLGGGRFIRPIPWPEVIE